MESPLVSIIIPCYNGEEYVHEAIESALKQTYHNKEVIVVDDGSTDGSLSIIKSYRDKIRWETGPNRGAPSARNRGLEIAKGDMIQFLDADDILHEKKLEEQVPVLFIEECDIVYSDWRLFYAGLGKEMKICACVPKSDDSVIIALDRQNIQTSAPLHKRDILSSVGGFRKDLPCCQEWELHLRLASYGARFRHYPNVLHDVVRRHAEGICADELRVLKWRQIILVEAYEWLRNRGELSEKRMRAFASAMVASGRRLLQLEQRETARSYFAVARKLHPKGGLRGAYSRYGETLVRVVGPVMAETILMRLKSAISLVRAS